MGRKPKYSKEDFVIEAVNKMLEKHNTTFEQVSKYPVYYNGEWYQKNDIYEMGENGIKLKENNIISVQIAKDKELLTLEYEKSKVGLEGEQLEELTKKYKDDFSNIRMWEWFDYYTWTIEEKNEFEKWFIDECRKRFRMTKKTAEQEIYWWLLEHGIRTI